MCQSISDFELEKEVEFFLSDLNDKTFRNLLHSVDMNYRLENEVDCAITELDVMNLRDQLESISKLYLNQEVPFHLIEGYREDGIDEEERKSIELMKNLNSDIQSLLSLSEDIDDGVSEYDIISFRETLSRLTKQEKHLLKNIPLRTINVANKRE
ncbi:hypothetical protein K5X82_06820 [Halosquirtibacter xylanolyticus]|uniref:hypothetical protein n=1 Tax=Halosquirtibacter xylanolyticus TaxID=3374599 RepID=UPI0037493E51|nr:hypothetical protein K5X82_06820 [Prolixibacteraceae bacterium]